MGAEKFNDQQISKINSPSKMSAQLFIGQAFLNFLLYNTCHGKYFGYF